MTTGPDAELDRLCDKAATAWDDEDFVWFAMRYGNPPPSPGQCNGMREQIRGKLRAATLAYRKSDKKKKHLSIACDGKNIYILTSPVESLAFGFQQTHNWCPPLSKERLLAEYDKMITTVSDALKHSKELLHQLQWSLIALGRQCGQFGDNYERNPEISELRFAQEKQVSQHVTELSEMLQQFEQEKKNCEDGNSPSAR